MQRWSTTKRAIVGICLILVGCQGSPGETSEASPTPLPTPPNTVDAICDSASPALLRLARQIDVSGLDAGTLGDQGAVIAQITGILTTDAERLRELPSSSGAAVEAWIASIEATADVGVTAVKASASQDVDGFADAVREFERLWVSSREASASAGYSTCQY